MAIVSRAGEACRHPARGRETIAILDEFLTLIHQRRRVPNPKCVKVDDQFPFDLGMDVYTKVCESVRIHQLVTASNFSLIGSFLIF